MNLVKDIEAEWLPTPAHRPPSLIHYLNHIFVIMGKVKWIYSKNYMIVLRDDEQTQYFKNRELVQSIDGIDEDFINKLYHSLHDNFDDAQILVRSYTADHTEIFELLKV